MEFVELLKDRFGQEGYTLWSNVAGRGTRGGEPHEGNHAWPTMNDAILTVVEDEVASQFLDLVRTIDKGTPGLGLRAFVWNIDQMY